MPTILVAVTPLFIRTLLRLCNPASLPLFAFHANSAFDMNPASSAYGLGADRVECVMFVFIFAFTLIDAPLAVALHYIYTTRHNNVYTIT